jgi:hypothetical protein
MCSSEATVEAVSDSGAVKGPLKEFFRFYCCGGVKTMTGWMLLL